MRGLGSHSCGPLPEEEFELHPHAFEFAFALGGNLTPSKALELVRSDFGVQTHALTPEETAAMEITEASGTQSFASPVKLL